MVSLPTELRDALDGALARHQPGEMGRAVQSMIRRYREGFDPAEPVLGSELHAAAYAAYRMPATYAAVSSALGRVAALTEGFAPRTHVDVGGGTGTAVWAAAEAWPSLEKVTVLEQAPDAIALGRRLMGRASSPALRGARWQRADLGARPAKPPADLVTMSYVLGELPPGIREDVLTWLAEGCGMVVVIEPGTPEGYARTAAARDLLIGLGLSVVAPCPHDLACPLGGRGGDWCHFSARLNRTSLHRQLKTGTLNFEDEKFSYVAASRLPFAPAHGRVLRHPQKRKGLVSLQVCSADRGVVDVTISKRQGEVYKAARDVSWGDEQPPVR